MLARSLLLGGDVDTSWRRVDEDDEKKMIDEGVNNRISGARELINICAG